MGVDIKLPIGLMFSLFGIILTVYGIISNGAPIYQHSFNININLWSGIFMLVFGGIMLLLAFLSKAGKKS
ncbi:MAG: hypothetical protein ACPLXM_06275 [Bacteroidales bacterium]|nr:hypothetical protein [Bacteroidales bacterium]HQK38431.1 hypothetical protein [Bacteroidales bacterium]